jgi:hypothetical protein
MHPGAARDVPNERETLELGGMSASRRDLVRQLGRSRSHTLTDRLRSLSTSEQFA